MDLPPAVEIVVTAPRLPEAPGEAVYSSVDVPADAITHAARADDALRATPGVSTFRRNNSSAANPTIQGLSVRASAPSGAGRTLVTLDGAPLNDPFGGWVIWGAVAPESLSGARIVRGAGAGPYGAGALLGAVSLFERQDGAAISLEGGERGFARLSGAGATQGDPWRLFAAGSHEESGGWTPVRAGRGAADTALTSQSTAGAVRLQWRDQTHIASARLAGYDEERSAGLIGADSENSGSSLSLVLAAPEGAFGWRAQLWAMQSGLANSSVAVSPDRSSTTPANDQFETPATGLGGNLALRWTNPTYGIEIGGDLRAADGETRELFRFQGGAYTRSRVAGGQTVVGGVYAEGWTLAGPWLMSGGVRLDQWRAYDGARIERDTSTNALTLSLAPADNDALAPTARFGFRRQITDAIAIRSAAYAGFRPPTLNELHRPFRVGNDVTEANSALDPERLAGADIALEAEAGALTWSIGAFATRLEDAITNVTLGAGPGNFPPGVFVPAGGVFRQRQNAGVIDAVGLEAEANGLLGDAVTWRLAVNYTDAEIGGLRPPQAPELSVTAGLSFTMNAQTRLYADLSYESARFEDDLNTRTLSAATLADLRLEFDLSPSATLFAAIDNAFDAAAETAESADGIESFGAPRTARIGLRFSTP